MAFYRFSVYLLKDGVIPAEESGYLTNIIKTGWKYKNYTDHTNIKISSGAGFYLNEDPKSKENQWETYLNIKGIPDYLLKTVSPSAIVCVPYSGKRFILCFGHASFHLDKDKFVEDFGSKAALNLLNKNKIKSLDAFSLISSKKERIQSSKEEDFVFYTADTDESLIKNVSGSIKDKNPEISNIVGDCGINVSTEIEITRIDDLLKCLLKSYKDGDKYLSNFPEFKNIVQEHDTNIINNLNYALINELQSNADKVIISQPIIEDVFGNYSYYYKYNSEKSEAFDNISIENFSNFVNTKSFTIDENLLEEMKIKVVDNNQNSKNKDYSLFDVINYTTVYNGKNYYLFDGKWNLIDDDYITRLNEFLKNFLETTPPYLSDYYYTAINENEDKFNKFCSTNNKDVYLLDKNLIHTNISSIEAADLLYFPDKEENVYFIHNKLHKHSSTLSHLFNQGYVSAKLLINDSQKKENLKNIISSLGKRIDKNKLERIDYPSKYKIIYGIIDNKINSNETDKDKLLDNLPLLSRIALQKTIKNFFQLGINDIKVCFIHMEEITSIDFRNNVPKNKKKYPSDIILDCNEFISDEKRKYYFQNSLNNNIYKALAFSINDKSVEKNQYAIIKNKDNKDILIIKILNIKNIDITSIKVDDVINDSFKNNTNVSFYVDLWIKQVKRMCNLNKSTKIQLADIKIIYPNY